ncbi:MAG TPA: kynureninase [Acidimicrobiia bacterium]|nr:kynureninase [Acidimicrobiia bacterium]
MTMLSDLGPYPSEAGYQEALTSDATDPLAEFRYRFVFTEPDLIYLDGNSLGRMPLTARRLVDVVVEAEWGDRLIRSWNEGWWDLQLKLGDLLAPLIGASGGEVIISDSTSVNLFKLATAAVRSRPGRHTIVTDDLNFPSDVYVLDGITRLLGAEYRLVVVESDGIHGAVEALAEAIDSDTALVSLSHTSFKSGFTYDMAAVTEMGHAAGALVLWDLSHSVGAVPIDLGASGTDLAVGCTYKYLNGGPGAPAFLYVRSEHQDTLENPITAWWGHADPFAMDLDFEPVYGIRRFHTGTMPILSLAAIEAGIRDVAEAGMNQIRSKSVALSEYLISLWETHLQALGFSLASPQDPDRRGSHIALAHPEGWPITRALIDGAAVIPDFRAPDTLRLGLSPLYTSFLDVHTAVLRLKSVVETGLYEDFRHVSLTVT